MPTLQKHRPVMRVRDMTQGDPLKLILAFAVPLFIGNIFQQIYTMVDTMVAGHALGDTAIAAIGATSSLYSLILNVAIGMNSGYGIVVTRSFGARDPKTMKQSIAGMMTLNTIVTVAMTVLALVFLRPLLRFMNTPESIFEQTYVYIAIICGGMISTVCYNMFAAILRAVGNSRSPLYFLIVSCLLNILLDVLLVVVIPLGIAGAAIATVIAQTVSAILCAIYVFRSYQEILPGREDFRVPGELLKELLSTGVSMALMVCVVDLGSVIYQRANNQLGEVIIAAHTASRRIFGITSQPLGTIASANATFVAQNWGAKKPGRIQAALKKVFLVEILWSVFICAVVFLFGEAIVRFTTGTTHPEILSNAVMSLRIHLSFFIPLGILLCLRTTMQAIGRKLIPVLSSCIELAMKILAAWWLIPAYGFVGTSVTEPVTWVFMMVFLLAAWLLQGKKLLAIERVP